MISYLSIDKHFKFNTICFVQDTMLPVFINIKLSVSTKNNQSISSLAEALFLEPRYTMFETWYTVFCIKKIISSENIQSYDNNAPLVVG